MEKAAHVETILVVDDEPNIVTSLTQALAREGYRTIGAANAEEALSLLAEDRVNLALLDVWMPKMDGLALLSKINAEHPNVAVVMMSGHGSIDTAVKATRMGAYDFLEKPLSLDRLLITLTNALGAQRLARENEHLRRRAGDEPVFLGASAGAKKLLAQIKKAAVTHSRVLIQGESGTGKELIARLLHKGSPRAGGPFIPVNCAAIPEELIESELFGHEKGAFTGATATRAGRFEEAHRGTLFLDEVGDMAQKTQAKLLRALQEGEVQRVGGGKTTKVDVRVVAATNRDLAAMSKAGAFRDDLLFRLNVFPVHAPSLRERREDIPLIAADTLARFCRDNNRRPMRISAGAMNVLASHDYPGNVRELKNVVERMAILCDGEEVTEENARESLPSAEAPTRSLPRMAGEGWAPAPAPPAPRPPGRGGGGGRRPPPPPGGRGRPGGTCGPGRIVRAGSD